MGVFHLSLDVRSPQSKTRSGSKHLEITLFAKTWQEACSKPATAAQTKKGQWKSTYNSTMNKTQRHSIATKQAGQETTRGFLSQRVSSSVFTSMNKDGLHVLELTTDHAWHSVIGRHLPLARFGAQLLDLLFLSAVKQWSLLCGHQQHLVTVFHLNHTWRLFQQQDGVTHTLLKHTNTPVLPSYHLSKQVNSFTS